MTEPKRILIEEGAGTPAGQGLAIIIDDDLTIQQDSGFTVVLGFTVVRNPSRVPSRWAKLAVNGTAFDYKGAVGLTQSLALATGGAVYLTQTDQEGEHYICAASDHLSWQRPR